jgi:heme exporter protein A
LEAILAIFVADNLACVKQDRWLFEQLSFSLEGGELLYVEGQNGAGKTSLLRMLCGLSQPNIGQIYFEQLPIQNHPDFFNQLIFIGHKSGNSVRLSARENVIFWCHQHQIAVNEPQVLDCLCRLGLVGLEDLPVYQLSAGQERRVALARLWLKPAKIWILDEPYTALDVQVITLLNARIAEFVGQGGIVIMTSHQSPQLDCKMRSLTLEYRL